MTTPPWKHSKDVKHFFFVIVVTALNASLNQKRLNRSENVKVSPQVGHISSDDDVGERKL